MNYLILVTYLVAVSLGVAVGAGSFLMGYYLRDIHNKLSTLLKREPQPQKPSVVNPLPPDYVKLTGSSAVVTPKSPQQIDREEELRIQALR